MASNGTLIRSVQTQTTFNIDGTPNGIGDPDDIQNGSTGADTYLFDNTKGGQSVGDKQISFGSNDSLLSSVQIFDGNNDGIIVLGGNARLDVERSSSKNAGSAQFNLVDAEDGTFVQAVRFLGNKADAMGVDASFVYADADTRFNLQTLGNVIEGTVGDDDLAGTAGVDYFLYDTALGLNLGGDTITGFGVGDFLVTTSEILNRDGDGFITFGTNNVLDLPGAGGGANSDPTQNPGGQIDFGGTPTSLVILDTQTIGDVTYYFYGFPSL